ncbi:MAG: hypothetical protein WCF67_11090 [Chitinophagaceae bacterium]
MARITSFFYFIFLFLTGYTQDSIYSLQLQDVRITIDQPVAQQRKGPLLLILYALPNGNTTEQTMGKKMMPGDDWHFDIQHIRAQTKFLRQTLTNDEIAVAYLENDYKSWPLWKRNHPDFSQLIPQIVDSIRSLFKDHKTLVYLNGHSGGGSFIFGYLDGVRAIPSYIRRISFIDSNYGYDSIYTGKLVQWMNADRRNVMTVFAYNDSVALLNDKPVVSATGGTWYKTHRMLMDLSSHRYRFREIRSDSIVAYKSTNEQAWFFLKLNPDRKIFHTQQVELNGFIHAVLCGTKKDSQGYRYYDKRVYEGLIE